MRPTKLFISFAFLSLLSTSPLWAQSVVEGDPSVLKEDRAPDNYVYDLKVLIKKSKENIKTVNDKIKEQAARKRNQQREVKAREYYLRAQKLAEEGRLDQARDLYERAIRITEHPEMKYYIKESAHRAKVQEAALAREEADQTRRIEEEDRQEQEEVEGAYQAAVSLYKQQKFQEAQQEFLVVEGMVPDYKAVRSYLEIITQDIAQQEREAIKTQHKEVANQAKEAEIARLREKELWRKEIEQKEKAREEQLRNQAQEVYDQALKLYQDRQFLEARKKFQEVEWVIPDFKAARLYLKRIETDIEKDKERIARDREKLLEKQRWQEELDLKKKDEEFKKALLLKEQEEKAKAEEQAAFVYDSAMALFNDNQLLKAKERFEEVEALYPNYKLVRDYIRQISDSLRTEEQQRIVEEEAARKRAEKLRSEQLMQEADKLFSEGVQFFKTGRLIEAKEKFLAVDQRVPDYRSVREYFKKIDDEI
ncbi:MAG: hypothetical protein GX606_06945, partial [Elusimicrobia bacterium]|nr:hypothetical protein [Elusimicrobiota bacterium]